MIQLLGARTNPCKSDGIAFQRTFQIKEHMTIHDLITSRELKILDDRLHMQDDLHIFLMIISGQHFLIFFSQLN